MHWNEPAGEPLAKAKHSYAKQAMRVYHVLYEIEREAKDQNLTPEARYVLRQTKSQPILKDFEVWLDELAPKSLPKSPFGKALAYWLIYQADHTYNRKFLKSH